MILRLTATIALTCLLCSCAFRASGVSRDLVRLPVQPSGAARGEALFSYGDLGALSLESLETSAVPWKVAAAALVLDAARHGAPVSLATLRKSLSKHGFIFPTRLSNARWLGVPPASCRPLGIVSADVELALPAIRVDVANLSCAACHAGVTYDALGRPQTESAWLGSPNTSLDLQAYAEHLYGALRVAVNDSGRLIATIEKLFGPLGSTERETISGYVAPAIRERMKALSDSVGGPFPFSMGGPGYTNGIGVFKLRMGRIPADRKSPEFGFTSIPDLGGTALRTSLLYDGMYRPSERSRAGAKALAPLVALFRVPAQGVSPERAHEDRADVEAIVGFVAAYTPPPFPGAIDVARARRGRNTFERRCAGCHGRYEASRAHSSYRLVSFPNRRVPQRLMNTDSERWASVTDELVEAVGETPFAGEITVERTGGYVAPPLTGLWATAPYLHNGSVPSLWHLLHPTKRPSSFRVGGHALDFETVGLDYPPGYQPWSTPAVYDTALPGRSNAGHSVEFDGLSEADKEDLVEFLKQI